MAEYYVERQYWTHWPKVLLMCSKHGDGIERRRYVPDRGKCRMLSNRSHGYAFLDVYECSACGESVHIPTVLGKSGPPNYCPNCGRKVVE